jgi:hypothetical protein
MPDLQDRGIVTDQLTTTDVASLAGVTVASIRQYRLRGSIPLPDGYLGTTPWWQRATIETWLAERPKRGRPSGSHTPSCDIQVATGIGYPE